MSNCESFEKSIGIRNNSLQLQNFGIKEYFGIPNAFHMIIFYNIPIFCTLIIPSNKNWKWSEEVIQSLQSVHNIIEINKFHFFTRKHGIHKKFL